VAPTKVSNSKSEGGKNGEKGGGKGGRAKPTAKADTPSKALVDQIRNQLLAEGFAPKSDKETKNTPPKPEESKGLAAEPTAKLQADLEVLRKIPGDLGKDLASNIEMELAKRG